MIDIVLASHNLHKFNELKELLRLKNINLLFAKNLKIDLVAETGVTFIENALIKARHVSQCTEMPVLADDSGLVVPSLKGEPGIYSARYAGENATQAEHWNKLLEKLTDKKLDRSAYFYCCLVYLRDAYDPVPVVAEGIWQGKIAEKPSGEHGFGYDPLFYISELQKTAAELEFREKNQLSHRTKAVKDFILFKS